MESKSINESDIVSFTKSMFNGNKSGKRFILFYGTKRKFKQFLKKLYGTNIPKTVE
jgi:hypothetical protein